MLKSKDLPRFLHTLSPPLTKVLLLSQDLLRFMYTPAPSPLLTLSPTDAIPAPLLWHAALPPLLRRVLHTESASACGDMSRHGVVPPLGVLEGGNLLWGLGSEAAGASAASTGFSVTPAISQPAVHHILIHYWTGLVQ